MAEEQVQVLNKKVLVIIHKDLHELKFYLKGEMVRYFIKDQGEGMFDMFVEEIKKEELSTVDIVRRLYKDYNAENIGQLFVNLYVEPSKYFEMLTSRKEDIGHVIVIYEDGFDVCTTYKYEDETRLSRCFGVYKDKKKISYSIYAVAIPVYEEYNNVDYDYDELLDKAIENPKNIMDELTAKYVFGISV